MHTHTCMHMHMHMHYFKSTYPLSDGFLKCHYAAPAPEKRSSRRQLVGMSELNLN